MWKIFESMLSRPPFCKSIGDLVNISVGKMSEKWIDQCWRDILTESAGDVEDAAYTVRRGCA